MNKSNIPLRTPILFLTFNRPDTTQIVFNEIRKAQPAQLFIATDVPREDHPEDVTNCKKVMEILQQVDWKCKVSTLIRRKNLGCKFGPSSAIDWFFSQVEEGIILEDDCVPDQSFFPFCQDLLEKYRDDKRIMMISGNNFQFGRQRTRNSYYFSIYPHIWGWASWKRAWDGYDVTMKKWPLVRDGNWLMDILKDRNSVKYWSHCFDDAYDGKIDAWDYQWTFYCWMRHGLSILPNVNLVSNIGFGQNATHTKDEKSIVANIPAHSIQFPLIHPEFIIRDCDADEYSQETIFQRPALYDQIIQKIIKCICK